jgi:hypothetical protein
MQSEVPNLEGFFLALQLISGLTVISSAMASIFGGLLYAKITNKRSLLWPITFVIHPLVSIAGYKTEKIANAICTKKRIVSKFDMGNLYLIMLLLEIAMIIASILWFSMLSLPNMNDFKILLMACTAAVMFGLFSSVIAGAQFYYKKLAITEYIANRKSKQ